MPVALLLLPSTSSKAPAFFLGLIVSGHVVVSGMDLHQRLEHTLSNVCCHRRLQLTPLRSAQMMAIESLRVGSTAKRRLLAYSGTPFID
jgi:hypothetical protein